MRDAQTDKIDAVASESPAPFAEVGAHATNGASLRRAGGCSRRECTTDARISGNESRPRSSLRIPSARRATGQYGIEQRRGLEITRAQIRVEGDLLRQLAVRYGPFSRRGREPIRKTVLTPSLEDAHECAAKACRVQHHELLHEDQRALYAALRMQEELRRTRPVTNRTSRGISRSLSLSNPACRES